MKKLVKIIGAASAVALAAGLVPTHFKTDKETGLLWNLKKAPGEEEDTYTMKLLPFIDTEDEEITEVDVEVESEDVVAPNAADETVEEPFAEDNSNEIVVETEEAPSREEANHEENA